MFGRIQCDLEITYRKIFYVQYEYHVISGIVC